MRRFEIKKSYLTECVEKNVLIMKGDEVDLSHYWLVTLLLVNRGMMDTDLRFWNTVLKILDRSQEEPKSEGLRKLMEEQFCNFLVA